MGFKINYGSSVGTFPTGCAEQIKRASLCDLKDLWLVCAAGGNVGLDEIMSFTGEKESAVMSSLSYWRGAGVLDGDIQENKKKQTGKSTPVQKDEKKVFWQEQML